MSPIDHKHVRWEVTAPRQLPAVLEAPLPSRCQALCGSHHGPAAHAAALWAGMSREAQPWQRWGVQGWDGGQEGTLRGLHWGRRRVPTSPELGTRDELALRHHWRWLSLCSPRGNP